MPIEKIKSSFLQRNIHNAAVQQNINTLKELLSQNNNTEIIENLSQWPSASLGLRFNNHVFYGLLVLAIILIAITFYVGFHPIFLFLTIGMFIFAFLQRKSHRDIDQIIETLKTRQLEENYHLQFFDESQPISQALYFTNQFPLFDLGDYDNSIKQTATGQLNIHNKSYPFILYQYHYINRSEDRDRNGNKSYRYDHHDLWGIFMENLPIIGISISTHQKRACRLGVKWTTSDIKFNNTAQMSGTSEMQLARFFTPKRILELEKMFNDLRGDFYVHPQHSLLCWQFEKNIFETYPSNNTLSNVHELADYLNQLRLHIFENVSQGLESLIESLDS